MDISLLPVLFTLAPEKAEEIMVMTEMWKHYKGFLRLTRFDLKPPATPVNFGNSKSNGVCWHVCTIK
jgi:hypothetical protein